jgi:hypothetical protein
MSIALHGHRVEPDAMCGEASGLVMSPIRYDLAGSTFAAIALDGGCEANPFPPDPPYNCSLL